jgi:hypothetical protein
MNPRLSLLPMSEEDTEIWHLVVDRFYAVRRIPLYSFTGLWSGSLLQARRDADLMFRLTRTTVEYRGAIAIGRAWVNKKTGSVACITGLNERAQSVRLEYITGATRWWPMQKLRNRFQAKVCQHDLQKPDTTIEVDGERNAKCTSCKTEWPG